MSFDPCHDCGTSFWILAVIALVWAVPLMLVVVRRHRGDVWADDPKLVRAILFLMGMTLWASWSYGG